MTKRKPPQTALMRLIRSSMAVLNVGCEELAPALGMSVGTFYNRRQNLDNMTLGELRKMREVFGTDRQAFLNALDI